MIVPISSWDFDGYLLVTPESFFIGNRLFEVKFIELFARRVARDVRTFDVKMLITSNQLKCKPGMSTFLYLKPKNKDTENKTK